METAGARPPRPLPVVTDDLALRFADTVDDPAGEPAYDHLGTYPELLAWAEGAGLLDAAARDRLRADAADRPRAAAAALGRAHRLRAAVAAALPAGPDLDRAYLALRPFVAEAAAHAEYRADGTRSWPVASRLDGLLWPVARAAEDLIGGPDLARVKRCAGCTWLFVDRSRNGQRRWCDMNDCGRQEKIRRYVAKRRATRAGSAG